MYVTFTYNLYKKLIENEFRPMMGNEISGDSKSLTLIKAIGPVTYCVNIINLEHFVSDTYEAYIEQLGTMLTFNGEYAQHIIMLNILISEMITEQVTDYINKVQLDLEQKVHNVNWAVDLTQSKLITAKDNDELLDIHTIIKDILASSIEGTEHTIELDEFTREVVTQSALKVKSQNSYLTYLLIGINWIIFCVMFVYGRHMNTTDLIVRFGANSPEHIFYDKQYYRLFTSMFIHIDLTHIMYNSFSLYLFGSRVEKYFGKKAFLSIYLISGLVASMASVMFTQSISAGASGAVYGLIGAVCVLSYQKNKQIDGLSFYIMLIIAIVGVGFGALGRNIDNFAHIGGMVTGYAIGFIFCEKNEKYKKD
jgi:membrane associated rhomboid family serine protease